MNHPLGAAPIQVGTIPTPAEMPLLQGTSATDLQRIIGASFMTAGVLPNGGLTAEGTSSMAYKVNPGACVLWSDSTSKRGLLIGVEAVTIPTAPAPATGSRIDSVYVTKEGTVGVVAGTTIPGGGVSIERFTVPAGITATTSALKSLDRNYAIPVGATLGLRHKFHDPANGVFGNVSPMSLGQGEIVLPSDRLIRFDMTHCISAEQNNTIPGGEATVMRWRIYIDDQLEIAFTTRAEWDNPQTNFMSFTKPLSGGTHKVHYVQDLLKGARFKHHKGTAAGYAGNRFEVWDAGVSR